MIINHLLVENFKSFKHKTLFDLRVNTHEKNIVLIQALNGVGKTSFLQAVTAAFFGLGRPDFERYISYGEQTEWMTIEVEFYNTNDYKTYKINRRYGLNKNKTALNEELNVFIDDELIENFNEEKLRLYLQSEFPEEISAFFFFDGEKIQQTIDYKNPREIKSAIEKVLGIENLKQLKELLTQLRSAKIQKYGTQQTDKRTKSLNLQLKDLLQNKSYINKNIEQKKERLDSKIEDISKVKNNLESLFSSGLSEKKLDQWNKYKKSLLDLEKEKSIFENKLEDFINNNLDDFLLKTPLKEATPRINEKYTEKLELDYEMIKDLVIKLYKPKCINCETEYNSQKFAKVEKKLKEEIDSYNNKLQKKETSLNKNNFIISSEILISKDAPNPIELVEEIEARDLDILNIQREISSIERVGEMDSQLNELKSLQDQLEDLAKERSSLEKEILELSENLESLEKKISEIEFELENLIKRAKIQEIEKDLINTSGNIISALNEYIDSLVVEKKEKLRSKTEEMFGLLSNVDTYKSVEIGDDYKVELLDMNGIVQKDLSSGFKQVLMTSLIWGLKECSEKSFPVIIDTPLARLDPIHRENMLTKFFPTASAQVIILSQPSEITPHDLKNRSWTKFLKEGQYIQMNTDTALDSTVIKTISI